MSIFAAMAAVPPPQGLEQAIWTNVSGSVKAGGTGLRRRGLWALTVIGVFIAVIGLVSVLGAGSTGDGVVAAIEDVALGAPIATPVTADEPVSTTGATTGVGTSGEADSEALTNAEGDPVPTIDLVIIRAVEGLSKNYYDKQYVEGDDVLQQCTRPAPQFAAMQAAAQLEERGLIDDPLVGLQTGQNLTGNRRPFLVLIFGRGTVKLPFRFPDTDIMKISGNLHHVHICCRSSVIYFSHKQTLKQCEFADRIFSQIQQQIYF